jgi:hypothetical protein
MGANAFSMTTQDYTVTSGKRERSSPSLSALCGHPRHCSTTPGTATTSLTLLKRTGTGRRHAHHCTSYGPRQRHPRAGPRTAAGQPNSAPPPSKPVLETHRTRRDATPEARFARTTVYSMALHAMPLHVGKIVWHACKLLPP